MSKKHKRKGRKGFTLAEMMAAVFLSGAVLAAALPLALTGVRRFAGLAEEEALAAAGDGIFLYVSQAVEQASGIRLERGKENRPETGDWTCIYAEDGALWTGSGDRDRRLFGDLLPDGTEVSLEAAAAGRYGLELTVCLDRDGRSVYRRADVVPLLNLSLNLAARVEDRTKDPETLRTGKDAGDSGIFGEEKDTGDSETAGAGEDTAASGAAEERRALVLWYQNVEGTAQ